MVLFFSTGWGIERYLDWGRERRKPACFLCFGSTPSVSVLIYVTEYTSYLFHEGGKGKGNMNILYM
uniref:Uncharacterized protein n=1 Tax=Picea sitchensis TaxID=3332 RepID=A0A6B9XS48_PICSI|nr:hypothetical protein Q903MT_gene3830 [Picea sitchensis]